MAVSAARFVDFVEEMLRRLGMEAIPDDVPFGYCSRGGDPNLPRFTRRSTMRLLCSRLVRGVHCSHRPSIALRRSFIAPRKPSNGRTERPMLAQIARRPARRVHRTARRVQSSHGALNARTTRPTLAQRVHWSAQRVQSSHERLKTAHEGSVDAFRPPWASSRLSPLGKRNSNHQGKKSTRSFAPTTGNAPDSRTFGKPLGFVLPRPTEHPCTR
jgi:hypothetical protein